MRLGASWNSKLASLRPVPGKYGILSRTCAENKVRFMRFILHYWGKGCPNRSPKDSAAEIIRLYPHSNFTVDNLYCTKELFDVCEQSDCTLVGTVRGNSRLLPTLDKYLQPNQCSVFHESSNYVIEEFNPTRASSSNKKKVLFATNRHNVSDITFQGLKSSINVDYNKHYWNVDKCQTS